MNEENCPNTIVVLQHVVMSALLGMREQSIGRFCDGLRRKKIVVFATLAGLVMAEWAI